MRRLSRIRADDTPMGCALPRSHRTVRMAAVRSDFQPCHARCEAEFSCEADLAHLGCWWGHVSLEGLSTAPTRRPTSRPLPGAPLPSPAVAAPPPRSPGERDGDHCSARARPARERKLRPRRRCEARGSPVWGGRGSPRRLGAAPRRRAPRKTRTCAPLPASPQHPRTRARSPAPPRPPTLWPAREINSAWRARRISAST